jgi:hypothetical protein
MTNMTLIEKIKGASTLERQQLAAAISAASEQMDVEQKRALVKSLTEAVHASDAKHSREERRISRIEAASKNPAMEVPFKTALRSLGDSASTSTRSQPPATAKSWTER